MIRAAIALAALCATAACATRPPAPDAALAQDRFVLERDLLGRTIGEGTFSTITGLERGFTAELNGGWDGETLTLVEDFVYDDGETDRKTWRLTRLASGEWRGTREDVVGAARGYYDGDVFRLEYRVDQPAENGRTMRLGFRDVLARRSDGVVINRATVGYYGVRVGRVELTITRVEDDDG